MPIVQPYAYIDPPEVEPYRYGLFGSSQELPNLDPHWLIGGVEWESYAGLASSLYPAGVAQGGGLGGTKVLSPGVGTNKAWPFAVYAGIACGTLGYTAAQFEARARRVLALSGQHAAELALWSGAGTTLANLPAPVAAVSTAAGGTLAAATYGYRVSAVNLRGETLASAEVTQVTALNGQNTVTWAAVPGAASYKVYGRAVGAELLMGTTTALTFLDNGSITPAGPLPGANTTGAVGPSLNIAGTPDVTAATPVSIVAAVRLLENWIADNYAGRAQIHAKRGVSAVAGSRQLVRQEEGPEDRITTPVGTRFVFGGGYDGTGPGGAVPAANQTWIYVTGQTVIARGEPLMPVDYQLSINRANNTLFLIAEQPYIIGIDGTWAAALVDLTL